MTTEEESPIIRTSPRRFGKGLAIILGLMAIGAGMHFAFSSEWNRFPPSNQLMATEEVPSGVVTPTGVTKEFTLTFVESEDFRELGFNAIPGEEGANPDIVVDVGDTVIVTAINGGKMPHAFGVVSDPDNPATLVFDSNVKSANDPLTAGKEGMVEFMPTKAGEFYYICLVPGHPAQGMQGNFVVKPAEGAPTGGGGVPAEPTGISHTFDLAFAESDDLTVLGFNAPRGEADSNPEVRVKAGDSVTVNVVNSGKMPHAFAVVTDPENPNSIVFDSAINSANNPILREQTGSVEFMAERPGHYFYICTVPGHPQQGMMGDFIVE